MRLGALWNACQRATHQPRKEEPKQAVNKGLTTAILSLVAAHLVPVTAALVLVSINLHGYYIGGELSGPSGYDDVKLSGLQFAAKLHELAIQGSLSVIIVGLIRQELVAGEGIPFGAIFGSLQFSDLSYLFSKEFLGILRARFEKPIVKIRLIALIVVGALLALTAGPSSAIAMRPRLDNWPAGGTDFYLNTTVEEIWPSLINATTIPTSCSNITLGTACMSRNWEAFFYQLLEHYPKLTDRATMPESLQIDSPESIRLMYTRQTQGLYTNFETVATTQMSTLADSLAEVGRLWAIAANELYLVSPKQPRKFMYRNDATYFIKGVRQPITAAKCQAQNNTPQLQQQLLNNTVEFPIVSSLCNKSAPSSSRYSMQSTQSQMIAEFLNGSTSAPHLQFVQLDVKEMGNNTIGAFATFPSSWPSGGVLLTCAVDARWVPSTLESTRNIMKVVSGRPTSWPDTGACISSAFPIKATSEWAQYLNPYLQSLNRTLFHTIVDRLGLQAFPWTEPSTVQALTESILTTMITSGLARTASSATIQGQLKDCPDNNCDESCGAWCLDMMPKPKQEFGYGGDIYNLSGIPDPSKLAKFTVQVEVNGYAYSSNGATMILSCAVLLAYCVLVGIHSAFVLITRRSSNAWDSVSEVTALAMQSQPTEALINTCAGINTTRAFSNLVRIVRTGPQKDHLELDFGDHSGEYGLPLIEDEFYG